MSTNLISDENLVSLKGCLLGVLVAISEQVPCIGLYVCLKHRMRGSWQYSHPDQHNS